MEKFVAVVICVLLAAPAAGATQSRAGAGLLHAASQRSGLAVRRVVPERTLRGPRYDAIVKRASERAYPRMLRQTDVTLYMQLGLLSPGSSADLSRGSGSTVWYDAAARSLLLRRATTPTRARMINELVRALVDQHFKLKRLAGLRVRDRDRALAADGIVDGTAALASGARTPSATGTPFNRFVELDSGLAAGRSLAKELRYLGGARALATALTTFPQTTEQLLHMDKFLERERALPVRLPKELGGLKLRTSETFGELDVRSLLGAYRVPDAAAAAAGWGGGRVALYVSPQGDTTTVLLLRWDSFEDAVEWRTALMRYIGAAFADESPRDCPPLDECWGGTTSLGAATIGQTSVFASGSGAAALAAAALAVN